MTNAFKNSEKFVFRNRWYGIELIHRKALLAQISRSARLKGFVEKKFGTTKKFFEAIVNGHTGIFDLLDRDDVLIAIVLGYGEENGGFYLRRSLVGRYLKKYPLFSLYPFQGKPGALKIRTFCQKFRFHYMSLKPRKLCQFILR